MLRVQEELEDKKTRTKERGVDFKELTKRVKREYGIEDIISRSRKGRIFSSQGSHLFSFCKLFGIKPD